MELSRTVEKIGPHPPDHANLGHRRFDFFGVYRLYQYFHGAYLSTSAFLLLYQFMKAEVTRLIKR